MVSAVGGVLEVQDGSPVVGEVLRHLASGAGSPLADVALHGDVEGVTADDVVKMSGRDRARLHYGIQTLVGQGRAWEAEAGVDKRGEREGCGERLHLGALGLDTGLDSTVEQTGEEPKELRKKGKTWGGARNRIDVNP